MAYWLMKTEPDAWSWDQQVKAGAKGEAWTGVRNHTAKQNLDEDEEGRPRLLLSLQRRQGDRRHRRGGHARAYPDPTAEGGRAVGRGRRRRRVEPLPTPVTLAAIKAEPKLKDMALVKYSRLSVQPVTAAEWKLVCKMGGVK